MAIKNDDYYVLTGEQIKDFTNKINLVSNRVLVATRNVTTSQELLEYLNTYLDKQAPILVKVGNDLYTAILLAKNNSNGVTIRTIGSGGGDYQIFTFTVKDSTWTLSSVAIQKKLVSGTDIKTINNESILGSGNITISSGSSDWNDLTNKPEGLVIDSNYQHTDNNYTTEEKTKLATLANYDATTLTTRVTALETNKANTSDLHIVATSGSYNDLTDKPTIPEAYNDTALTTRVSALESSVEDILIPGFDINPERNTLSWVESGADGSAYSAVLQIDSEGTGASLIGDSLNSVNLASKSFVTTKIAEAMTDVDNEHFHVVTTLPDVADAKDNHEYVFVTYEQDGVTIASEVHYLFYDGEFHQRRTGISLEGYATEQYVNTAVAEKSTLLTDTAQHLANIFLPAIDDAIMFRDLDQNVITFRVVDSKGEIVQQLPNKDYVDSNIIKHVELTQAEYDALTSEEKNNGTVYFITDGQGSGGGGGETPDLNAVLTKGYTSDKTIVLETGDATTTGISDNAMSPHLIQLRAYGSLSAGRVFTGAQLYPDTIAIATTVEKTGSTEKNEGFTLRIRPNLANDRIDTIVSMSDGVKQAFRTALDITEGGSGVPIGGTTGQALVKKSDADQDVEWGTIEGVVGSGWGIAKTGVVRVNLPSDTGANTRVDLTDLNLASVDDYNVAVTQCGGNAAWGRTEIYCAKESATILNIGAYKAESGSSFVDVSYTVVAKGYGVLGTGDLPTGGQAGQYLMLPSDDTNVVAWGDNPNADLTLYSRKYGITKGTETLKEFALTSYTSGSQIYGTTSRKFSIPIKGIIQDANSIINGIFNNYDLYVTFEGYVGERKVLSTSYRDGNSYYYWDLDGTDRHLYSRTPVVNGNIIEFEVMIMDPASIWNNNAVTQLHFVARGNDNFGTRETGVPYDIRNVTGMVLDDLKVTGNAVPTDWGLATVAKTSINTSSGSTTLTIDVSGFGFESGDDYTVLCNIYSGAGDWAKAIMNVGSKNATSFMLIVKSVASDITRVDVEYAIFAKGYGNNMMSASNAILESPNGTKYKLKVADDGSLSTEAI